MNVSEVTFRSKTNKLFGEAKLCLVFKGGDEDLIEDVFTNKVKSGKLDDNLKVVTGSAEFDSRS